MRKYKSDLLESVRRAIMVRHYSIRTEQAYIHWVRRYIFFINKQQPITCGAKEVEDFLTWLAVDKKVATSTQNQALNALVDGRSASRRGAGGVRSPLSAIFD